MVDGDRIADDILQAGVQREPQKDWILAASIESDLSLTSSLKRLSENIEDLETAVGDRWLSLALCKQAKPAFIQSNEFPGLIGCEDSGHIVLPIPFSQNKWGLVGDGAMTLISTILARSVLKSLDTNNKFQSGWKLRKSVKGVDRKLWDGKNKLSVDSLSFSFYLVEATPYTERFRDFICFVEALHFYWTSATDCFCFGLSFFTIFFFFKSCRWEK